MVLLSVKPAQQNKKRRERGMRRVIQTPPDRQDLQLANVRKVDKTGLLRAEAYHLRRLHGELALLPSCQLGVVLPHNEEHALQQLGGGRGRGLGLGRAAQSVGWRAVLLLPLLLTCE